MNTVGSAIKLQWQIAQKDDCRVIWIQTYDMLSGMYSLASYMLDLDMTDDIICLQEVVLGRLKMLKREAAQ